MPAGTIKKDNGVSPGGHAVGDFFEMLVHAVGVGARHDHGGTGAALGTDGTENIGRGPALVAWRAWPRPTPSPDPGQRALLTDPCFILEPDFDRFTLKSGI